MIRTHLVSKINYSIKLFILLLGFVAAPVLAEPALAATKPMVNINTATAEELAQGLTGVGPAKAQAIIQYREMHGPFANPADLGKVKGIGPSTLEKNLSHLEVQ